MKTATKNNFDPRETLDQFPEYDPKKNLLFLPKKEITSPFLTYKERR